MKKVIGLWFAAILFCSVLVPSPCAAAADPKPPFLNKVKEGERVITGVVPKGNDNAVVRVVEGDKFVGGGVAAVDADGKFTITLDKPAYRGQKLYVIGHKGETAGEKSELLDVDAGKEILLTTDPTEGPATVEGTTSPGVSQVLVEIIEDGSVVKRTVANVKDNKFSAPADLTEDQTVQVFDYTGNVKGAATPVVTVGEKPCPATQNDCRNQFEAGAHLGVAVDTFASDGALAYLNPEAAAKSKERFTAGFEFAYRLFGDEAKVSRYPNQLWAFGETLHAVRSTEFDCNANPTSLTFCSKTGFVVPPNPSGSIFAILRAATSLEAFTGLRYEFLTLGNGSSSPANLYLKGQLGFLKVSGRPDDAVDVHHVGLGLTTTKGRFIDSYLEAGFGRTDLFERKRKDRWKLDGLLSIDIGRGVSFYTQILVDADAGFGSDSVQSYYGFSFDLKKVSHCWFRGQCK